jgi:dienelactone hydrolase
MSRAFASGLRIGHLLARRIPSRRTAAPSFHPSGDAFALTLTDWGPYYGSIRNIDALPSTQAAVLAIYAGEDPRITGQAPDVEQRLKAAGKMGQTKIYAGTRHSFFNDTGTRYDAEAAKDAWTQTLAWFRRYLT